MKTRTPHNATCAHLVCLATLAVNLCLGLTLRLQVILGLLQLRLQFSVVLLSLGTSGCFLISSTSDTGTNQ